MRELKGMKCYYFMNSRRKSSSSLTKSNSLQKNLKRVFSGGDENIEE
jgi:hypothetical protein